VRCAIAIAMVLAAVTQATATPYQATFDCGHGLTVWIGQPIYRKLHERIFIFQITVTRFNLVKSHGVVRSPAVEWHDGKMTLAGRPCREIAEPPFEPSR